MKKEANCGIIKEPRADCKDTRANHPKAYAENNLIEGDSLRQERNSVSSDIGALMRDKLVEEAKAAIERIKGLEF